MYLHEFSNLPRIFAQIGAAVSQDSSLVSSTVTELTADSANQAVLKHKTGIQKLRTMFTAFRKNLFGRIHLQRLPVAETVSFIIIFRGHTSASQP